MPEVKSDQSLKILHIFGVQDSSYIIPAYIFSFRYGRDWTSPTIFACTWQAGSTVASMAFRI